MAVIGCCLRWTQQRRVVIQGFARVLAVCPNVPGKFCDLRGETEKPESVVVLTIALPTIGSASAAHWKGVVVALGKAALILAPVGFLAAKLVPRLMRRVARTRSEELYLLVALAIGFATAAISQAVGLSLAAGAFLAGMIVSSSEFAHETLAHLLPLRDTFVALFFVTILNP